MFRWIENFLLQRENIYDTIINKKETVRLHTALLIIQ